MQLLSSPSSGVPRLQELRVLPDRVSTPANVATVPVVGSVNDVAPDVANVMLFPPRVSVHDPLDDRVTLPETVNAAPLEIVNVALVAGAVIVTLLILVAVATPRTGVTSVGVFANTRAPVPVSSLIFPASSEDVHAVKSEIFAAVEARVPDVGSVTLVEPVATIVTPYAPDSAAEVNAWVIGRSSAARIAVLSAACMNV